MKALGGTAGFSSGNYGSGIGTGQERITFTDGFDGFPVFSPDGRYLVWGSNRNQAQEGDTNVFIAEWVE